MGDKKPPTKVVYDYNPPKTTLTTVHICGSDKVPCEHVWDDWKEWKDEDSGCSGGSAACSKCGMLQMDFDLMRLP